MDFERIEKSQRNAGFCTVCTEFSTLSTDFSTGKWWKTLLKLWKTGWKSGEIPRICSSNGENRREIFHNCPPKRCKNGPDQGIRAVEKTQNRGKGRQKSPAGRGCLGKTRRRGCPVEKPVFIPGGRRRKAKGCRTVLKDNPP